MLQALLEPIVKYVEAAAHLAAIQAIGPINAERRFRINEAGRAANAALRELTIALLAADTAHHMREIEEQTSTINVLARKLATVLEDTRIEALIISRQDATSVALSDDRS